MALYDLVRVRVTTTGVGGPLQLGIADGGGRTFAQAGVPDGASIPYGLADGGNREIGRGIYSAAGNTLERNFLASTTGTALELSGNAVLEITLLAADFPSSGTLVDGDYGDVRIQSGQWLVEDIDGGTFN
jgi:hypothetical protein